VAGSDYSLTNERIGIDGAVSITWQGACDHAGLTDWSVDDQAIVSIYVQSISHTPATRSFQLRWRNKTDSGTFATLSLVTGEVRSGVSAGCIANGDPVGGSAGCQTTESDEEVENETPLQSVSFSPSQNAYIEVQYCLDFSNALAGKEYEFEVHDGGDQVGVVTPTITTAAGAATNSVDLLSDALIWATATPKDLLSDALMKKPISVDLLSDALMKAPKTKDLLSDALIYGTATPKDLLSDAVIYVTGTPKDLLSDAEIVAAPASNSVDLLSDALMKKPISVDLLSDALVKKPISVDLLSDAIIYETKSADLLSDALIAKESNVTLLSDALIKKPLSVDLLSDALIKVTATPKDLLSDALIYKTATPKDLLSDAMIVAAGGTVTNSITLLSDAMIVLSPVTWEYLAGEIEEVDEYLGTNEDVDEYEGVIEDLNEYAGVITDE